MEVFRLVLVICDVFLNVITSLAVVLLRKMKLVALLYCVVDVVWWPVSLPRGWYHVLFGSRGGSRISGKGGHIMYVCVCMWGGGGVALLILSHLSKISYEYIHTGGGGGRGGGREREFEPIEPSLDPPLSAVCNCGIS